MRSGICRAANHQTNQPGKGTTHDPDHLSGAPQPQEPKKKRGALKWILIVIGIFVALFVALVIIGVALGEDTATPPPAGGSNGVALGGVEATATPPPAGGSNAPSDKRFPKEGDAVPTAKVGDKVTDDNYQFTVTKVSCGVRRVGDQYDGEKAQGQFCLVSLKVKNVGQDPITFSDQNQALVDATGRIYSPDDEAWVYVDDSDNLWGEINPGNSMKTVVPFDVPKKTEPDYLLLKAGVWGFSEGVRVKL
jgi:Domain of unknown function (DUF4352)